MYDHALTFVRRGESDTIEARCCSLLKIFELNQRAFRIDYCQKVPYVSLCYPMLPYVTQLLCHIHLICTEQLWPLQIELLQISFVRYDITLLQFPFDRKNQYRILHLPPLNTYTELLKMFIVFHYSMNGRSQSRLSTVNCLCDKQLRAHRHSCGFERQIHSDTSLMRPSLATPNMFAQLCN